MQEFSIHVGLGKIIYLYIQTRTNFKGVRKNEK
jgi:hypothetical protein